ncbi:CLUMA_CG007060, isoform A [Clunio marinus]|uniref:Protein Wnt n=1 Tax=Clunio marinus TaxID=568069 RepID=A0A1J1HZJ0_9DIPT|nr:CLUMA_CG007060, isoform A [Clunio marinus]
MCNKNIVKSTQKLCVMAEGSNILLDPMQACKKTRKIPNKILDICKQDSRNKTSILKKITKGISLGFRECENQFRHRKWNCTSQRRSMKKILLRDTRETAFVNAITAAGISYTIAKACSMGELVECSCDKNLVRHNVLLNNNQMTTFDNTKTNIININKNKTKKPRRNGNNKKRARNSNKKQRKAPLALPTEVPGVPVVGENWEWSGCDDNVNFGNRKSKDFLDARLRRRSDIKTLVKIHNNNAGRLAVKKSMRLDCKCHGLSGSCTMKTCWMKLPSFTEVAHRLRDRFDGASKVISNNDGTNFMTEGLSIKPPTRQDLVYTDESPDFCRPNRLTGSLGVQNRECNITSSGEDGCEILCCNNGYQRSVTFVKSNCKCRFIWCCDVVCNTCLEKREIYTCR